MPVVRIDAVRDAALSWHIPPAVESIRGLRLFVDAPRGGGIDASIVRSIVRANPHIGPLDALQLAIVARRAAEQVGLPPFFVAATILQESAFDPSAVSDAGAFGIAQFTFPTAAEYGIDPFAPRAAIAGAAALLARYVAAYARRPGDPYALALAAYNAGPGAVAYYGGVPPYPETRDYIADIYERWGRLVRER